MRLRLDLSRLADGEHLLEIRAVRLPKGEESDPVSVRIVKKGGEVTIATPKRQEPIQKRGAQDYPRYAQALTLANRSSKSEPEQE